MLRVPRVAWLTALAAALLVAVVVLAAAEVGPVALVLCVPAALTAALVRLRFDARQEGLRLLARADPLTGLGNQRLLRERLLYEIARHRRHKRRFALFVLDLDGFKQVNDRFGHVAGDEVLREVARSLAKAVRDQDTVTRMGGDEFCVLAPETGWQELELVGERLRAAVRRAVGGLDGMDVTVGAAVFPDEGTTPELLLSRADAAETDAKRRGRHAAGRAAA